MTGKLYIVSGPFGSGKSTITKSARDILNIPLAISATTRQSRKGEIDGVDYYFLKKEDFEKKIKNNEFFEYANVHGNYYGTLNSEIEDKLSKGIDVILEIDVQGAILAKQKNKDATLIFCKTDTLETLEKRLRSRNTDNNDIIEKRLKNAKKELEYINQYDYVLINDNLDDTIEKLVSIIKGDVNEEK